ncbi:hypothetical protein PGTUg99_017435 [Puccinia graminis f. sp. tritici]|uniref:Uncharacterized protein n=1 Tax=Puccinia graminis f. sp. tritici TaxID=56615 RepID=A0A5B0SIE0_PUCGR|nr:hypothetical protein PGTUg99_017435 [Puccinia graminis f. sp. tritici]
MVQRRRSLGLPASPACPGCRPPPSPRRPTQLSSKTPTRLLRPFFFTNWIDRSNATSPFFVVLFGKTFFTRRLSATLIIFSQTSLQEPQASQRHCAGRMGVSYLQMASLDAYWSSIHVRILDIRLSQTNRTTLRNTHVLESSRGTVEEEVKSC